MKVYLFTVVIIVSIVACKRAAKNESVTEASTSVPGAPAGKDTLLGPKGALATMFQTVNDLTIY